MNFVKKEREKENVIETIIIEVNMPYPIKYFSYSNLLLYYSCRYCWKQKYLHFLKPQITYPFFEFGRKYHENVHNYHTGKPYDTELISLYTAKYPSDYRRSSELKFNVMLPGVDLLFNGIFDGITETGICDLKTGKTKPSLVNNFQVVLYVQAYKELYKKEPTFVFNHFNGKKIINMMCHSSDDDFKQFREEKLLPYLEAIKNPGSIEVDGMERTIHLYLDCPFYVGKA